MRLRSLSVWSGVVALAACGHPAGPDARYGVAITRTPELEHVGRLLHSDTLAWTLRVGRPGVIRVAGTADGADMFSLETHANAGEELILVISVHGRTAGFVYQGAEHGRAPGEPRDDANERRCSAFLWADDPGNWRLSGVLMRKDKPAGVFHAGASVRSTSDAWDPADRGWLGRDYAAIVWTVMPVGGLAVTPEACVVDLGIALDPRGTEYSAELGRPVLLAELPWRTSGVERHVWRVILQQSEVEGR